MDLSFLNQNSGLRLLRTARPVIFGNNARHVLFGQNSKYGGLKTVPKLDSVGAHLLLHLFHGFRQAVTIYSTDTGKETTTAQLQGMGSAPFLLVEHYARLTQKVRRTTQTIPPANPM